MNVYAKWRHPILINLSVGCTHFFSRSLSLFIFSYIKRSGEKVIGVMIECLFLDIIFVFVCVSVFMFCLAQFTLYSSLTGHIYSIRSILNLLSSMYIELMLNELSL